MTQGHLFSQTHAGTWRTASPAEPEPAARRRGPSTSKSAAHAMKRRAPRLRDRLMEFARSMGHHGFTNDEAAAALGIVIQSMTPRTRELVKLGLVRDSGRKRPSSTGSPAIAWTVQEATP